MTEIPVEQPEVVGYLAPVNCVMSEWTLWADSECTEPCGGGVHKRERTVVTPAEHGGEECGIVYQELECNVQDCPVECQVSGWMHYTQCSVSCGGGTYTRTREVTSQNHNEECP